MVAGDRNSGPIAIRQLGKDDLGEALAWRMEVLSDVFAEDEPWDRDVIRAANEGFYRQHLGDDLICCVASVGAADAGCGAICIQPELPSPDNPSGMCAYLMNIYTRSAYRVHGVGHAAVSWLIARARERGAGKVYLEATEAGCAVYEGLGFKPMEGMMKLSEKPAR